MISHWRLLFCWLICCPAAWAHKPSDSYLRIVDGPQGVTAQWDIALRDLEFLIGLDADHDGDITWGELKAKRETIAAHALSRLAIVGDGSERAATLDELLVSQHSDGSYAALQLAIDGPGNLAELEIRYDLLFEADPTHRGLVFFDNGNVASTHVLSPESPQLRLQTNDRSVWHTFIDYVREGVWHIWIGLDHILFLLSLLLPGVLVWRDKLWHPIPNFQPAWRAVLKIVTVFTVAHSITLWLSVMEYVTLPAWLVESAIAFSIIVTAVSNLYPVLPLSNAAIAFGFGLVHGFGFANVLLDLGLSSTALAVSLFGFNVGVELGQLAIVAVFLPIAYWMRSTVFYHRLVLQGGSVLVALVASVWVCERMFNVEVLGI